MEKCSQPFLRSPNLPSGTSSVPVSQRTTIQSTSHTCLFRFLHCDRSFHRSAYISILNALQFPSIPRLVSSPHNLTNPPSTILFLHNNHNHNMYPPSHTGKNIIARPNIQLECHHIHNSKRMDIYDESSTQYGITVKCSLTTSKQDEKAC